MEILVCVMVFVWSAAYEFQIGERKLSVWCEFVDTCEIRRVELREAGIVLGSVDLETCEFQHWAYLCFETDFKTATQGSGRKLGTFVEKVSLKQTGNAWILTIDPCNVLASASGGGLTVNGRITREISFISA
jgi:hypothetical protein